MIRLKVKEIAKAKGVSQSRLGRLADVDVKTMRRIYREPTSPVTTTILDRIATALNVDASLLLESEPPLPKTVEGNKEVNENPCENT
jgi:transcriptional regulator with XRE-family HTH domain